jgi:hypothetical protein
MNRLALLLLCAACAVHMGFGADFGVTLHQNLELQGEERLDTAYAGGLGLWVSAAVSENVDVYFSGNFALKYENKNWYTVPELARSMIQWRPLPALVLDGGRIRFTDHNQIVAAGLFDGLAGAWELGSSRLTLGAYYSGLLYKDTADIFMTGDDVAGYIKPLDYVKFGDTYFASRRFLAQAGWELPALRGSSHGLYLQGLAQFDLNGRSEKLHTQYLSGRFLFSPLPVLDFTFGGILGFAETTGSMAGTETGFAFLTSAAWAPPSVMRDRLTLGFRYGSGRAGRTIGPFRQITAIGQGNVLNTGLAGLALMHAAYLIQPLDVLSFTLDGRYFLRTDLTTYTNPWLQNRGQALGAELYASMTWVPLIDVSLAAGCGVFLPGTGNAFSSDTPSQWEAALALLVSL